MQLHFEVAIRDLKQARRGDAPARTIRQLEVPNWHLKLSNFSWHN